MIGKVGLLVHRLKKIKNKYTEFGQGSLVGILKYLLM